MKKIIILAVLLLMGTVGTLQADTEYPLELIVEVHFTQDAYGVEIGYSIDPCSPFTFYSADPYGDIQAPAIRTYTAWITSSTHYPACAGVVGTTSSGETITRTREVPPGFDGNPIIIYWPGGGGGGIPKPPPDIPYPTGN